MQSDGQRQESGNCSDGLGQAAANIPVTLRAASGIRFEEIHNRQCDLQNL
jgi:hypothetical protein